MLEILFLELCINKYNPLRASTYIPLPPSLQSKKAIINMQNDDEACFAWAITSALRAPSGLSNRTSSYPHYSTVCDFSDVEFPVKIKDIRKFEAKNNLCVNVYGIKKERKEKKVSLEIVPLKLSSARCTRKINLLYIVNDNGVSHYCWIRNLARLVGKQLSLHGHEKFLCDGCLVYFGSVEKLKSA